MARARSTWTCCCSATWSCETDRLTLPHPQVTSRRFVLEPLLELDPELALPDGTRARRRRWRSSGPASRSSGWAL